MYRAKNCNGDQIAGTLEAESLDMAAAYIQRRGYFVTSLKAGEDDRCVLAQVQKWRGVSHKEIAVFCRKLAIMIQAGIPLLRALRILTDQTNNARLREALAAVYTEVERGQSLTDALKHHPRIFPPLMVHMVHAGEEGGVLGVLLERLSVHFEKDHKMREKIKTEMMYPAVLLCLTLLVVLFILIFVLPVFVTLFDTMQLELPLMTRILLRVSSLLRAYGGWILVGLWIGGFIFAALYRDPRLRLLADQSILRLPLAGTLMGKIYIARFCRNLATLLHHGITILAAVGIVRAMIGNRFLADRIGILQSKVQEGTPLAASLKMSGIFESMVVQMVEVGQETGQLDGMLDKIADFYETDVDEVLARLSTLLQPMMIVVLASIIGSIVLAVALPMFDSVTHAVG